MHSVVYRLLGSTVGLNYDMWDRQKVVK
jgi:hypothetical protein